MPTYDPERWINIANQKGFNILDIKNINIKTFTYDDKLQLQCNECKSIYNPSIGEMIKAKYLKTKCRCQTWKSKKQKVYEDTEDWKVISKINHPMSAKYRLDRFQPYYMISRNGEVKNAALEKDCNQPSLSNEIYSRVNLRLLSDKAEYRSIGIHILVACAFVPVPEEKLPIINELSVDHKNKNTHDNRAENLRWATKSEQALNKNPQEPGSLWIQNNRVFFNEEDFLEFGNVDQEVEVKTYQNFQQRVRIEDEINYPEEIWKRVEPDSGEKYLVSSMGRCYYEHLKAASFGVEKDRYLLFHHHRLHRLIARAFLPTEEDTSTLDVNHKNGRTYDNRLSNLEWITKSGNSLHAVWLGTKAANAEHLEYKPKGTPIRVQQIGANHEVINSFPSLAEASKQTDISERKIKRSLTNFENSGTLSFIDGSSYAWIPAPQSPRSINISEHEIHVTESKLDLSQYVKSGNIRIGKYDFQQLKQNPDTYEAIMKILEQFDAPILPIIDHHKRKSDWTHLFRKNSRIEHDSIVSNLYGRYLLNHFMLPVMIKGRHKNRPSYTECWNDKELRGMLVMRMLKYNVAMNNNSLLECYGCEYGRIYNFPPNVAKALYNHSNSKRVLDFCAGYGGRLTGFWASQAEEYVGIDPNSEIPYKELIDFLQSETSVSKRVQIIQNRAEAVDYDKLGKFDTVFTSPPYFSTEIYSDDPSQSCHMYPRIEDWLNKFLFSTILKVINVLIPGGVLMINIKDSNKNAIVEPMMKFFREETRLVEGDHIKLIQSKRHRNNKQEYIYVWHFPKPKIIFEV